MVRNNMGHLICDFPTSAGMSEQSCKRMSMRAELSQPMSERCQQTVYVYSLRLNCCLFRTILAWGRLIRRSIVIHEQQSHFNKILSFLTAMIPVILLPFFISSAVNKPKKGEIAWDVEVTH